MKLSNEQLNYLNNILVANYAEAMGVILESQKRIQEEEKEKQKNLAKIYGFKYSVGTTFRQGRNIFTVVEIQPNRPKFPYIAKNESGTRYKWKEISIDAGLVKSVTP
jgi:hypothetical protein